MPRHTSFADAPADAPRHSGEPAGVRVLDAERFVSEPDWPPTVDPLVALLADEAGPRPTPPPGVADYVIDPLDRQDASTLLQIADYAEELAAAKAAEEYREAVGERERLEAADDVVDVEEQDSGSGFVVTKMQQCGQSACHNCPHGPYKWRVTRDGDAATWTYLGKAAPSEE